MEILFTAAVSSFFAYIFGRAVGRAQGPDRSDRIPVRHHRITQEMIDRTLDTTILNAIVSAK